MPPQTFNQFPASTIPMTHHQPKKLGQVIPAHTTLCQRKPCPFRYQRNLISPLNCPPNSCSSLPTKGHLAQASLQKAKDENKKDETFLNRNHTEHGLIQSKSKNIQRNQEKKIPHKKVKNHHHQVSQDFLQPARPRASSLVRSYLPLFTARPLTRSHHRPNDHLGRRFIPLKTAQPPSISHEPPQNPEARNHRQHI